MLHEHEPDLRDKNPNLDLSEDGNGSFFANILLRKLKARFEESRECLMALSLRFCRGMETSSPGRQMRYLDHGLSSGLSFLSDALNEPPQAAVYQGLCVDEPSELHFEGDGVHRGPSMSWLWTTGNRMVFNYHIPQNEHLMKWGYVFWDQKRLGKWDVPNEEYGTWVGG